MSEGSVVIGCLKFRVASKVFTVDKDVGYGSLPSLLLEGVLDIGTVAHLVELDDGKFVVLALKQLLGSSAMRAGGLAVNHDLVRGDLCVNICDQIVCLCHLHCLFVLINQIIIDCLEIAC